jgi:sugar lactone lactonase YvrE
VGKFAFCRDHHRILLETETTGRLLRYDPETGQTAVLLTGLSFPNGVQLSRDQSFLLMTETANCR